MLARILLMAIAVIAFAGASRLGHGLSEQRQSNLVHVGTRDQANPMLAFTTVVLGGFSGIIADLLWLRATSLQDQGRYVELVQLSDWITKFEPRATQAWAFHAWNMAYNVSAMMPTPKEKWRWVRNGIVLLRDQGLSANPNDAVLCFELAMLYQHKISYTTDDAHAYYKLQFAHEMEDVLPGSGGVARITPDRQQALWRDHRLDAGLMQALEKRYGLLDWRVPESHALYWAQRGLDASPQGRNFQCAHLIVNALIGTFLGGHLEFSDDGNAYIRRPNLDTADAVVQAFRGLITTYAVPEQESALYEFLTIAIPILEENNRHAKADAFRTFQNAMPEPAKISESVLRTD